MSYEFTEASVRATGRSPLHLGINNFLSLKVLSLESYLRRDNHLGQPPHVTRHLCGVAMPLLWNAPHIMEMAIIVKDCAHPDCYLSVIDTTSNYG